MSFYQDLVIIGAGTIGSHLAFLASKKYPQKRIMLLDRGFIGGGASMYGGAMSFPFARTKKHQELYNLGLKVRNDELYFELNNQPKQSLQLVYIIKTSENTRARIKQQIMKSTLHMLNKVKSQQLLSDFKDLNTQGCELFLEKNVYQANPGKVAKYLVDHFNQNTNTTSVEGVNIKSIEYTTDSDDIVLYDECGNKIYTRKVALCTGPWILSGLLKDTGADLGIRTKKIVAIRINLPIYPDAPILFFYDDDVILLPLYEENNWLLIITSKEWDCQPNANLLSITQDEYEYARTFLQKYLPSFEKHCLGGRVFCDAYTKDWMPLICNHPDDKRVVIAGAASGAGYLFSCGIAAQALEKIYFT